MSTVDLENLTPADPAEALKCSACGWNGTTSQALLAQSGRSIRANCPDPGCGVYIKFVARDIEPTVYFGKYNGRTVTDIAKTDPGYLRWLGENSTGLSMRLRRAIAEALNSDPR